MTLPFPVLFRAGRAALHAVGLDERRCAACLAPYSPDPGRSDALPLCPDCRSRLRRRRAGYCPRCGEIFAGWAGEEDASFPASPENRAPVVPCGACLISPPPWTEFRFYGVFDGLLRDLLHRAKYGADAAALGVLRRLMEEICADLPRPDAIVPLPLHPERLRRRGYNQSWEMARSVSRRFGAPLRDDLLIRTRPVRPQTGLNRRERQRNLDGVFLASPDSAGLRILLIDDTSTTGTTLRRAAEALREAGASRLDAAVAAHASLHEAHDPSGRARRPED